jgi:hypothetical protein
MALELLGSTFVEKHQHAINNLHMIHIFNKELFFSHFVALWKKNDLKCMRYVFMNKLYLIYTLSGYLC